MQSLSCHSTAILLDFYWSFVALLFRMPSLANPQYFGENLTWGVSLGHDMLYITTLPCQLIRSFNHYLRSIPLKRSGCCHSISIVTTMVICWRRGDHYVIECCENETNNFQLRNKLWDFVVLDL